MATKNKTAETDADVYAFIDAFVDNAQKKKDSYQLIGMMREWSGQEPKMWGPSIIGFGSHAYRYASGHEGTMPVFGFSPRKAALTLYVYAPTKKSDRLLEKLGAYKMSKCCIYVKRLSDIDLGTLEQLCNECKEYLATQPLVAGC
jgi:hypothetical protein